MPADYQDEVLAPFYDSLIQQISRALQFFYSSSTYNHVDCLVLAGGVVGEGAIADLAETRLELPVIAGNPFSQMELGDKIKEDKLKQIASSMLVATGLALRGIS